MKFYPPFVSTCKIIPNLSSTEPPNPSGSDGIAAGPRNAHAARLTLSREVCVRADPDGGGRSRVLDIDTLREEVRAGLGSRMLEFLTLEPAPWLLAPYREG